MPAGGPWTIFGVYSAMCRYDTGSLMPAEYTLQLESLTGDMYPGTEACQFPGMLINSGYDATHCNMTAAIPTIYDTDIQISGKSELQININWQIDQAQYMYVMAGIIFGKTRPVLTPIKWLAHVKGEILDDNEVLIGTITFPEETGKLVSVMSNAISYSAAPATPSLCLYSLRLASDDKSIQPLEIPGQSVIDVPDYDLAITGYSPQPPRIPFNVDLPAGSRISVYAHAYQAVNPVRINAYLQYE